jgi:hypothetical protein
VATGGLSAAGLAEGPAAQAKRRIADVRKHGFAYAAGHGAGEVTIAYATIEVPKGIAAVRAGTEVVAQVPSAGKAIVIGEGMADRVIPLADELGAAYYDPPIAPETQWMDNNRNWLTERMDEGCVIYDCGAAPGRTNYPGATSPYYQMELDTIAARNYPTTKIKGPQ